MTALVIQHEDDAPLGLVATPGLGHEVVRPYRGESLPETLDGRSGLIVLGGEMGAYDDAAHPWLTGTKALIREAARTGLPCLLICLGHQLGAVALGGGVARNPRGALWGVVSVDRTEAGRADSLLRHLPDDAAVVHWNSDVVTDLPDGATVLARDPRGDVQAVRYGPHMWGLQCHPEVDAAVVEAWGPTSEAAAGDPGKAVERERAQEALAGIRAREEDLRTAWAPVLEAFAALTTPDAADAADERGPGHGGDAS